MKKIIVVIGLILVSCKHNGKKIDEGVWICTKTQETINECYYTFTSRYRTESFQSSCDKWQIGDTL